MIRTLVLVALGMLAIMALLLDPVPVWQEEPTQRAKYSVTVQNGYIYIIDLEECN